MARIQITVSKLVLVLVLGGLGAKINVQFDNLKLGCPIFNKDWFAYLGDARVCN